MIRVLKRGFVSYLGERINGLEAKCCAVLSTQWGNEGTI